MRMIDMFSEYIVDEIVSDVAHVTKYSFGFGFFEAIVIEVDGSYDVISKDISDDGGSISFNGKHADYDVYSELLGIKMTGDFCRKADLGNDAGVCVYDVEDQIFVNIDLKDHGVIIEAVLEEEGKWFVNGLFLDETMADVQELSWLRDKMVSEAEIGEYVRSILRSDNG